MVKKRVLGWMDAAHNKARPIESTVMTVFTPSGMLLFQIKLKC